MSRVAVAVLVAAVLVAAACGGDRTPAPAPAKPVVVAPVTVRDLEDRIEATGELIAKYRADVAAQVSGEITQVLVEEGDPVKEGAVVMEIDPEKRHLDKDRARAQVGEAQAAVAEQQRELKRVRVLAEHDVASATKLDQAETALQTARARLAAAQADLGVAERALRDATVTAVFAGQIARRYVHRGEFVREGTRLFELVSMDPLEVEFHLPEADAARMKQGIPIQVSVAPYPDETFDATVNVISPTIDSRTRTLRVRALVPNADRRLRPGMFARANLGIALRKNVIMVPEQAVLQRSDGPVVFRLVGGNKVQRVVVETGTVRDGAIEVRQGLAAGDRVVSRGHADLIDGSVIVARNPDGSLASASVPPAGVDTGVAAE